MPIPILPIRARRTAAALALSIVSMLAAAEPPQAIVITGAREPVQRDRLAGDVAVIERSAIEASTADSVADLLRREAGVQLSRNGGPGQSTGILLRGAASVNTVVLVDGMRIGSATLGYAQLESLSPAAIERIEVLRGPGSSLYGADAVGGVVQIITRKAETGARGALADAHVAVGGYGAREVSAGVRGMAGAAGAWDYALTLSHERSDGVSAVRPGDAFGTHNPDRDGHALNSLQVRLGVVPRPGHRVGLTLLHSRLEAQFDSAEYPPPAFAPDPSPDFRSRLATDVAALDWRGALGAGLTGSARAARSIDDLETGGTSIDRFRTAREQFTAQLAWRAGVAGELVAAVETQRDRARASGLAVEVQRRTEAIVLALAGAAEPWSWQLDLRHDRGAAHGGVTTGRIGGGFALSPAVRLRALAGTTFRAPSFNDLYYPGYGVPTLRPERGRSIELGLDWQHGASRASATIYRNRLRELIGYESDPALCPDVSYAFGCARNLSRARLQGLGLSGAHRQGALELRARLDLVDATDESTGARLNRRAAHQASLAADWTQGTWTLGAALLRLGARPDGGAVLPAETTLDLSARWRASRHWEWQFKLLNATDADLQPVRDYQGIGRQGWIVLRHEGAW